MSAHEPLDEAILKKKSAKELRQILKKRRVDGSMCVEKNDMVQLILKTQPVIKPLAQWKSPTPVQRYGYGQHPSQYNVYPNNDVIQQFQQMGLGVQHMGQGGSYENPAIVDCQNYLMQNPQSAEQWYNLGVHLAAENRMEASNRCYLNSVKYEPGFKLPHSNLGAYYKDRGDLERAVYHCKKALESDPGFAIALNNLAVTYFAMGKLAEAQDNCRKAIQMEPDKAEAHNNLGTLVLHAGCSAEECLRCFEKCIELDPVQSAGRFGAYSNKLLASNSMQAFCEEHLTGDEEDVYNNLIWSYHNDWAGPYEKRFSDVQFKSWDNDLSPNRTIRVGYLSSDLRGHPVSYFAEAALKHMDEKQIEVYCYLNGPPGDKRTGIIRTKIPDNRWRELGNRTPMQCAEMIRHDKIDILVELGGHAAGNRQDIVVLKPAPVQATWIGYANTTGLSCVDYRITDGIADPVGTHQQFSETLVRMPDPCAFLCYTGTKKSKECTGSLGLKRGYITFGSFNALHKLTDQAFELWCRILNAVPKSKLFLKNKPMASDRIRNGYIKRFKNRGISEDRLVLKAHVSSREEHMDCYFEIDVALDPFPYAGTTTSAEALWMGCPFITLNRVKFPIHAQNVGASFLNRIPGLKKFIAKSKKQYVERAVYWSQHMEELDKIKRNLRKTMLKSPLCNGPLFCEKLTEVYREMWVKHCQENSATH